jgi:mRNA interferase RelE/StbE
MAWRIERTDSAAKQLRQLDPQIARRILTFLRDRVAPLDDPRSIADRQDGVMLFTVIRLGNRREVYRR